MQYCGHAASFQVGSVQLPRETRPWSKQRPEVMHGALQQAPWPVAVVVLQGVSVDNAPSGK